MKQTLCALIAFTQLVSPSVLADEPENNYEYKTNRPNSTTNSKIADNTNAGMSIEERTEEETNPDWYIDNLRSFIDEFDGRKEDCEGTSYGKVDGNVTPKEYVTYILDLFTICEPIVCPPDSLKTDFCLPLLRRQSYYLRFKAGDFNPADVNDDGVINKKDDLNGDNKIDEQDKEEFYRLHRRNRSNLC
ncbi:hypothetical protein HY636_00945 [Candidatus Woesearchaeota archaeon]|nr:hypothetical protein [Candidatus Woesearchaeota archaeon]